jgi:hypothetical protein
MKIIRRIYSRGRSYTREEESTIILSAINSSYKTYKQNLNKDIFFPYVLQYFPHRNLSNPPKQFFPDDSLTFLIKEKNQYMDAITDITHPLYTNYYEIGFIEYDLDKPVDIIRILEDLDQIFYEYYDYSIIPNYNELYAYLLSYVPDISTFSIIWNTIMHNISEIKLIREHHYSNPKTITTTVINSDSPIADNSIITATPKDYLHIKLRDYENAILVYINDNPAIELKKPDFNIGDLYQFLRITMKFNDSYVQIAEFIHNSYKLIKLSPQEYSLTEYYHTLSYKPLILPAEFINSAFDIKE